MREKLPLPKLRVTVTLFVDVLASVQEPVSQSEGCREIRNSLTRSEVRPLQRQVRTAPQQISTIDFLEHFTPEGRVYNRKGSLDIVLIGCFDLLDDVNRLHLLSPPNHHD